MRSVEIERKEKAEKLDQIDQSNIQFCLQFDSIKKMEVNVITLYDGD